MDRLEVTYKKLLKYIAGNSLYQISQVDGGVYLVFAADFPEAEAHSRGEPVRVVFRGRLEGEKVVFESVQVFEGEKVTTKDPQEALYAYSGWLQFIEENF